MEHSEDFLDAVKAGDLDTVAELLQEKPGLAAAKSEGGVSLILLALYYQEPDVARLLVANGAPVTIFEAAALGDVERVADALREQPDMANAYAEDGFQPLGLASFFGHADTVELLLDHGADVNSASRNEQQVMPLHSAVAGGHVQVVRRLLDHGADVNAEQQAGFTPLHGAAQNGDPELVELLLANGANVYAVAENGQTAINVAEENGNVAIAELLSDHEMRRR